MHESVQCRLENRRSPQEISIGAVIREDAMKILVARIPEEGMDYEGTDPGTILELENDPFIKDAGDVDYRLHAERVSGELVVRGTLSAELEMRCARCAEFFSTTVPVSDFLRACPVPEGADSVDLSEDMREDILLHVPAVAVCSEDCKGVCPQCGINLNKGTCECREDDGPGPWSALDELNL